MPPGGNVLLDTSIVIPYLKGDVAIGRQMQAAALLYLPITAAGELYCGAYTSSRQTRVLQEVRNFLNGVVILTHTPATAETYGQIRAQLAKAGTPIPENDIWIAALAMERGMALVTRDAHFQRVSGLNIVNW